MTIVFEDENGTSLSIHYEDNEMYITVSGENEVDRRDNTMHIDDVEKFIAALKFVTGKSI
jgi:mannose-6-phosphate isomerase-like protein (cupin superfamily)